MAICGLCEIVTFFVMLGILNSNKEIDKVGLV